MRALRLLAISTTALTLVACGGGGGGGGGSSAPSSGSTPTPPPPPITVSADISGTVQKGMISQGRVRVVDPANPETVLVEGETTATGTYTVSIPESAGFSGPFVLVRVSGQEGARMVCDAPQGCQDGAIAFGDTFPVGEDVVLTALIPTPANEGAAEVHVTMASHMVAQLAQANSLNQENLNQAYGLVTNLLGLGRTDFTRLQPVDLFSTTTPDASPLAWRIAALNAGFMAALEESDSSLGQALASFENEVVTYQARLIQNEGVDNPERISLEDVFEGATQALSNLDQSQEVVRNATLQLQGELLALQALDDDTRANPVAAPVVTGTALDEAKAFVDYLGDARETFKNTTGLTSLNEIITNYSELEEGIDAFISLNLYNDIGEVYFPLSQALMGIICYWEQGKDLPCTSLQASEEDGVYVYRSLKFEGERLFSVEQNGDQYLFTYSLSDESANIVVRLNRTDFENLSSDYRYQGQSLNLADYQYTFSAKNLPGFNPYSEIATLDILSGSFELLHERPFANILALEFDVVAENESTGYGTGYAYGNFAGKVGGVVFEDDFSEAFNFSGQISHSDIVISEPGQFNITIIKNGDLSSVGNLPLSDRIGARVSQINNELIIDLDFPNVSNSRPEQLRYTVLPLEQALTEIQGYGYDISEASLPLKTDDLWSYLGLTSIDLINNPYVLREETVREWGTEGFKYSSLEAFLPGMTALDAYNTHSFGTKEYIYCDEALNRDFILNLENLSDGDVRFYMDEERRERCNYGGFTVSVINGMSAYDPFSGFHPFRRGDYDALGETFSGAVRFDTQLSDAGLESAHLSHESISSLAPNQDVPEGGSRVEYNAQSLSANLLYMFDWSLISRTKPLAIEGGNGFTFHLSRDQELELTGRVEREGEVYATVAVENGSFVFTFTDDSVVTLQ